MAEKQIDLANVSQCTIVDACGKKFIVSASMDGGIIIEADHCMKLHAEWLQDRKKLLVETTNYGD